MAAIVPVVPSPVYAPGVAGHFKITVGATAATLDSLVLGGIPRLASGAKPTAVYLAVQDGEVNKVFFTWDGYSTPAADLGFLVPAQPSAPAYIPCQKSGYSANMVKLVAPAGDTVVQVKFEWDSTVG